MADELQYGDHWAYFGDGNAALIIDSKEYVNKREGKKYVRFIFKPSKRIEQVYDIGEEQDDNGFIVRTYPWNETTFLERGVSRTRCWIYTDFNNGPTPASRRYKDLNEALNDTERLLRSNEAAKNRAYQELNIAREQMKLSVRTQTDIIKEIAKARGRVDSDEEEMSGDNPV